MIYWPRVTFTQVMTNLMISLLMTPFAELPTSNTCCRGAHPLRIQIYIFTLLLLHFPFLPNFVTQNFLATGTNAGRAILLYPLCACLAGNWTTFTLLYLMIPFHKGGDRSLVTNYRPVSLTSVFASKWNTL